MLPTVAEKLILWPIGAPSLGFVCFGLFLRRLRGYRIVLVLLCVGLVGRGAWDVRLRRRYYLG